MRGSHFRKANRHLLIKYDTKSPSFENDGPFHPLDHQADIVRVIFILGHSYWMMRNKIDSFLFRYKIVKNREKMRTFSQL